MLHAKVGVSTRYQLNNALGTSCGGRRSATCGTPAGPESRLGTPARARRSFHEGDMFHGSNLVASHASSSVLGLASDGQDSQHIIVRDSCGVTEAAALPNPNLTASPHNQVLGRRHLARDRWRAPR
ncbi:hypothetical protein GGR54DRAFT_93881 [Hypoxylon sp. NC1633]|nr:hypothetical protein GGR54DRAFT_93881 [Hypoxylon sp. NC1633]